MRPCDSTPINQSVLQDICGFALRPAATGSGEKEGLDPQAGWALDSLDDAVLITDKVGRVKWVNGRFAAMFGISRKDIVGTCRRETIEPLARRFRDPVTLEDNILWLYDHPAEEARYVWEMTDHQIISLSSRPIRDGDGKIEGRLEIYRQQEERRLLSCGVEREAIDTLPISIFTVDDTLGIVLSNRSGREFISQVLDYDPAELQSFSVLGHDHPLVKALLETLGSNKTVKLEDLDLGERRFSIIASPMTAGGRAYAATIALTDTTESNTAMATCDRVRRESEFFIDLLSHDIRNFNQISMGYMEILGLNDNLTTDERAFLDKALGGVMGSNKLIDDIRRVRSIRESGDKNIAPADLGKIIKGAQDKVKRANEGKVVVINDNSGCGSMAMANDFVSFVFQHILENAIKYDQHPEKVIDIDVIESRLDAQDYWTIRIADHGPGVPDDRKKSIFERMSGSTTRGAGLGLSIVKMIVDKLGGRIWVENRVPGDETQGSVFVVQLRKA